VADANHDTTPYQSLYRRFRPQRFAEVLGQEHVALALRNAVRDGRVGHAYLFSGPRGTGKTSSARILAKALNCAAPEQGEPCGRCDSCLDIARGSSLDVHELDAASNNGVDAMRDLVAHAALGTPGRWKVYIVDEVHMLSTAASNALLKTLEEPPGHVVFVLATTDAQKVLPTIRSRTQHFEFRLLGPETLSGLLRRVRDVTGLAVPDAALDAAVRRGRGSARDALSALDQVAAGGTVDDDIAVLAELGDALADRDAGHALVAVAKATEAGRDPQRLAADLADYLRQGFLVVVAADLVSLTGDERDNVEAIARRMGLPALVRCLEELGRAQVDMRDVPDARVHIEVALIKLTHPSADESMTAVLERLDRLERTLADIDPARTREVVAPTLAPPPASPEGPPPLRASSGAGVRASSSAPASRSPATDPSGAGEGSAPPSTPMGAAVPTAGAGKEDEGAQAGGGPELARRTLGAVRRKSGQTAVTASGPMGPARSSIADAADSVGASPEGVAGSLASNVSGVGAPSRDDIVQVWGDGLLATLPNKARARFRVGRFLDVDGDTVVFALPNQMHRTYCEEVRVDVEAALKAHFGTAVPLRLVIDDEDDDGEATGDRMRRQTSPGTTVPPADVEPDLLDPEVLAAETEPAGAGLSPQERLKQAFPGAHEV
jgi:DNA polymerase-3 subunit gamma/tau